MGRHACRRAQGDRMTRWTYELVPFRPGNTQKREEVPL